MAEQKRKAMNPILSKELRLGARSIRLPLTVMLYDMVLAIIAVITIAIATYAGNAISGRVNYSAFLSIYQVIGWTQLGITLLIVPILTAGSISGEREKQTLDIMLTTPKKPLSIVWGKLLAAISNYMMYIISSIPIMAIAFVLGGLNWFALLGYIVMMLVIVIYVGSVGVFCSSCFKKTIGSIVMTFLIAGALFLVPVVVFGLILALGQMIWSAYWDMTGAMNVPDINFGILPLILIANPLTGFLDYMMQSVDFTSIAELLKNWNAFGTVMPILAHAWIPLNVLASLAVSWFFLYRASKKLNPIKKRKKKRKQPLQPNPDMAVSQPNLHADAPGAPILRQAVPPQPFIPNRTVRSTDEAAEVPTEAATARSGTADAPQPGGTTEKLRREE